MDDDFGFGGFYSQGDFSGVAPSYGNTMFNFDDPDGNVYEESLTPGFRNTYTGDYWGDYVRANPAPDVYDPGAIYDLLGTPDPTEFNELPGRSLYREDRSNYVFDQEDYDKALLEGIDPGVLPGVLSSINKIGGAAGAGLKKLIMDDDDNINWKNVAALAGGLYGLSQSNQPQEKTGYQGGIPQYTAVRATVPQTDPNRRPGSGGQRYFTDVQYTPTGNSTARTAAQQQVRELQTENTRPDMQLTRPVAKEREYGGQATYLTNPEEAARVARDGQAIPEQLARMGSSFSNLFRGLKFAESGDVGGLAALAKGGEPRYLNGASDGMADKIPARIDGGQEARLSHGEFVISADVVSALGGGNSEAGAQRLYDMMDRIRKAAHGRKKQINPVDPKKVLPI